MKNKTIRLGLTCVLLFAALANSSAQTINIKPVENTTTPSATGGQLLPVQGPYATSIPLNSIRSYTAEIPVSDPVFFSSNARTVREVKQSTTYFDGLGRVLQTVDKGIAPNGNDVVTAKIYDAFGREAAQYLPYVAGTSTGNFKNNPFQEQSAFYTNNPSLTIQNEQFFYGYTQFEASPLNRVQKTMAPGNSWAGSNRGVAIEYFFNTTLDNVRQWIYEKKETYTSSNYNLKITVTPNGSNQTVTYEWQNLPGNVIAVHRMYRSLPSGSWSTNTGGVASPSNLSLPAGVYEYGIKLVYSGGTTSADIVAQEDVTQGQYKSTGAYNPGVLHKTITTDEHGKQVIEFKDPWGKVVLKKVQLNANPDTNGSGSDHAGWLCTYYIYDHYNQLRMVLQPMAVETLVASNWANCNPFTNTSLVNEFCFVYSYDRRNRMIVKKVPGAAEVFMVYDSRDRLIMTQDGNLRQTNKWLLTRYDHLNRPVETGLWNNDGKTHAQHQTAAAAANPVTGYPAITAGYEQLTKTFYDSYQFLTTETGLPAVITEGFNASMVNATNFITAYNTAPLYAQPLQATVLTNGMVTGSKVKVLGTANTFLFTVTYYDEKGRVLQVKSTNSNGGHDISTTQYDFAGKVLRSHQLHRLTTSATSTELLSFMEYDNAGRLVTTRKKLVQGTLTVEKTTAQLEYNPLGQLKTKKLGNQPGSTTIPLTTLDYDYNIRGWLTGVNRSYARPETQQSVTNRHFGMELSYDYGFTHNGQAYGQFNGNIAGIKWRSMGDGEYRSYGFTYDAANRIMAADFNQRTGASNWGKSLQNGITIDFSAYMGNGTDAVTAYDANGNIRQMQQKGLHLNSSPTMDNMVYTYQSNGNSNKLEKVVDGASFTPKLGDFKDGSSGSGTDYAYDVNGNLTLDNNKAISSITYNHLNLPAVITITGKGSITYTYDAAGNKLRKLTLESPTTANGDKTITTTTTYVGGFVYESKTTVPANNPTTDYTNKLQFAAQEEGRIRPLYDNTGTPDMVTGFAFDYFIKDHLGNVRMVLTDEQKTIYYPAATLEGVYDASSNSMVNREREFFNIQSGSIVNKPWTNPAMDYQNHNDIPPGSPNPNYKQGVSPSQTATSAKVYQLNATSNRTGLEMVIKVMAGDRVDLFGKSYHTNNTTISNGNSTSLSLLQIFTALLAGPANAIGGKGASALQLEGWNNGLLPGTFIRGTNNETGTTIPKAYINYIFLDEQFKFAGGGASRVGAGGSVKDHRTELQNINVPKNGYLFVYVSNESNFNVFFDNVQVVHKPGPIVEETHYYPFGLVMNGISSKALNGAPENKKKFVSQELDDDLGLNWYQFRFRNHDPQIGRFWQIDPLASDYVHNSTYAYAENDVIRAIDLEGLEKFIITNRSFHPDATFGGGFSGDARGFTTQQNSYTTSRIEQNINIDFSTQTYSATVRSDPSHHWLLGNDQATPTQKFEQAEFTNNPNGTTSFDLKTSYAGNNPLLFDPISPDIDVKTNMGLTITGTDNQFLAIGANMKGDNFPAAESFIKDANGVGVFIGVAPIPKGGTPRDLIGDNNRRMFSTGFTIELDKSGNFSGNIIYDGVKYPIEQWNKQFTETPAKK